ncbi:MAG: radical SAM protein [Promethearchaeota archaeon]
MISEQNKNRIFFLTFLISYKCTNECKHCAIPGSPNQDNTLMELDDVRTYLEDVTANYVVDEIGFFGGEPLLHFDLLINLIKEVKRFDIAKIGLPTNGFWGKNDSTAKEYALNLKEAGLNTIGFSIDTFHQEFVPLEVVKRAMKAAHEAGIERIYSMTQNIGSKNITNVVNEQNKRLTNIISKEFEFCQIIHSELQVKGRALKNLTDYYSMDKIPSDRCLIFKVPMFMIDPNGWVFHQLCQGICIGNAKQNSLSNIIRDFNYRKHPIIGKIVAKGGPRNLLEIAIEKGYKPLEGYADKCHLCFSVRNFLRPFYPNILEPCNLYTS